MGIRSARRRRRAPSPGAGACRQAWPDADGEREGDGSAPTAREEISAMRAIQYGRSLCVTRHSRD
jgi:hypothetical protein